MFMLEHVKPEKAEGKTAEAYSIFPPGFPVPEPLVLMSASPGLMQIQSQVIRHYMTHDKLDMGLLALIRYLVACEYDYPFCIDFNAGVLKMAGGFSEEDLQRLRANPEEAPLEDSQKALLAFVLKVVKKPEKVEKADIEGLREMGWSDRDIFDAAYHGTSMIGASKLYKAFVK
jgi:hypothetical protein